MINNETKTKISKFILRRIVVGPIAIILVGFFMFYIVKDIGSLNRNNIEKINTASESYRESGDNIMGNKNAKITIIEYSDLQCPYCARFHKTTKQILNNYPDDVKLIFRHFPLRSHKYAQKAAEASECAGDQGKFWEYLDMLFENQRSINESYLSAAAEELNLDTSDFQKCLSSGKYADKVKNDLAEGQKAGVKATPSSFINGEYVRGAESFENIKKIIEKLK